MKSIIELINQLSTMEQKLIQNEDMQRHFNRCKQSLQDMGYSYYTPLNEKYNDTRTDIEAHITGAIGSNMLITQVIKPVVVQDGVIVQKGIVIVENK